MYINLFFFTILTRGYKRYIIFLLYRTFSQKKINLKKDFKLTYEGIRYQIHFLWKINTCLVEDNFCRASRIIFSRYIFYLSGGEEIFPVGNISARRIAARNCIICKVPLKMSLPQHTFLATFLRDKAPFVRSRTHHYYLQLRHSHDYTSDTWHTYTNVGTNTWYTCICIYQYTLMLKRYRL